MEHASNCLQSYAFKQIIKHIDYKLQILQQVCQKFLSTDRINQILTTYLPDWVEIGYFVPS